MNIKINWGTGIFITIIVMIAWLGFLIAKSFEYKINIDSDDYYERGLDHSTQMNRIVRSAEYKSEFKTLLVDEYIVVQYPSLFKEELIKGELWFYRPSDYELDKKIFISNDNNNSQKIHIKHFKKGRYLLRATVEMNDSSYFFENEILIP